MRKLLLFVLLVGSAACSSKTPTAPTAAQPSTFALSGNVTSGGTSVVGATVTVVDGPNANRTATTSAGGGYQLTGLQAGGFTASIAAVDYQTTMRPVTLTADTVLNIDLVRLPRAIVENVPDVVQGIVQPDGRYAIAPTGINNGNGCAGSIAGSTDLRNDAGPIATIAWSLPPTTIVKPGERFTYSVCCISRDQAFAPGATYFTRFTFNTIACQ
jgi:Carboxypeptidase regulatory-like domain